MRIEYYANTRMFTRGTAIPDYVSTINKHEHDIHLIPRVGEYVKLNSERYVVDTIEWDTIHDNVVRIYLMDIRL